MRFRPVVGTLGYLWDQPRDEVLVVRRNARSDDEQFGKVNGLGGKVEPDEDVVGAMRRELYEEASVRVDDLSLRGTVTFTDFGPAREQWLIFVFLITGWTGEPPATNEEGCLEWVARSDVLAAASGQGDAAARFPMWPGDSHFVPLVFDKDPRLFHGTMPYDDDKPLSWSHERL